MSHRDSLRLAAALVVAAVLAGCPPGKPVVELPAPTGALRASLGTLSLTEAPRDVRVLRVVGGRLYVGDAMGLFVYGIADPSLPVLQARIEGTPVDDLAVVDQVAILLEIRDAARLRVFDLTDPTTPQLTADVSGRTLVFGGVAARADLVWHAVGSNPPSKLYSSPSLEPACNGPDNERGAMGVWLDDRFAYESVHFDDYAGDDLDGNGAYGLVSYRVETQGECPRAEPAGIFFFDTHALNRSAFERGSASDLQIAPHGGELFATGEQQLRRLTVDESGRIAERDAIDVPDALQLAVDGAGPCGPVVAVANGDVVLACSRDGLSVATVAPTPGIARELAAVGDGRHFYVGDDQLGLTLVRYEVP